MEYNICHWLLLPTEPVVTQTVYFYLTDKRLIGKPFIIEGEHIFCGDHVSQP